MVPLRIACPKCSGDHVQLIDLGMTCSHCGAEVRVVDERVTAERAVIVAFLRRRASALGATTQSSALLVAADDIARGDHTEGA